MSYPNVQRADEIYLDANATTFVLPAIQAAVIKAMQQDYGNPSSRHSTGIQAKYLMEQTRQLIANTLKVDEQSVLFTSGATEGIQTGVLSALVHARDSGIYQGKVLYGATEHKAVPNSIRHWCKVLGLDYDILAIPVDENGKLDTLFIQKHAANAVLVCTMAVNNETGVFQDLKAIEAAIRTENQRTLWLVDCVQALGKMTIDFNGLSIDFAPFSGHKLYAPKGIGFLYIHPHAPYTPFIAGGGQESGRRSGTENMPGVASLHALFTLLNDESSFQPLKTLETHRDMLLAALKGTFHDVTLNAPLAHSVPTTLNFSVPGLFGKELMDLFDASGIRVSAGSACSAGAASSFVLDAMGKAQWQSHNAVRLSFGPADSTAFIEKACQRIRALGKVIHHACLVDGAGHQTCSEGINQFRFEGKVSWLLVTSNKSAIIVNPHSVLLDEITRVIARQALTVKGVFCQIPVCLDAQQTLLASHPEAVSEISQLQDPEMRWQTANEVLVCQWQHEQGLSECVFVPQLENHSASDFKQMGVSDSSWLCPGYDYSGYFAMNLKGLEHKEHSRVIPVSLSELERMVKTTADLQLVDVRENYEHSASHLLSQSPLASMPMLNLSQKQLTQALATEQIDMTKPIALLCRSGNRSMMVANNLVALGAKQVYNLRHGIAISPDYESPLLSTP